MDSRCNVFDPCFVELDCGDDGAPMVDHLQRPVHILEVLWLDKEPKGAFKLFSATEQLVHVRTHGLKLQCIQSMFCRIGLRR
jgi:hypothetical protein